MRVELILGLVCVARVANGKPYEDGRGDEWARFLKHRELRRGREHAIAAGGLYSTVADVMKFYLMLANDGKAPDGSQAEYRRNLPELVSKIRRAVPEARLLYLTPTPYDDTADVANIPPGKTDWSVVNNKG